MTIDDILDADIDGLVERTKLRPIPRGAISLQRAWVFFFLQVFFGLYTAFTCLSAAAYVIFILRTPDCSKHIIQAEGLHLGLASVYNISYMQGRLLPIYPYV